VLAYLFWHRPSETVAAEAYEQTQLAFHRSLAHSRPIGMCASALFRVADIPWLVPASQPSGPTPGYEHWYLIEDYTALGVLNEAAVGHGHRTLHDEAARHYAGGAGGLYGLLEGERSGVLSSAAKAVWVGCPAGSDRVPSGELLGDGIDPRDASLWRRQLVLGPAPEFCLLAGEGAPGVGASRLPSDWTTVTLEREVLWNG
jgi:hypothetical protein